MAEPITFLACFVCGATSSATLATLCPRCEELRTEAAAAERCAPLVEAAGRVVHHTRDADDAMDALDALRDALRAYHAAQGAGRGGDGE